MVNPQHQALSGIDVPEDWRVEEPAANIAHMFSDSQSTMLPLSWTNAIRRMLYPDGVRVGGVPLNPSGHMRHIDRIYRLIMISQYDDWPSPAQLVRRMGVLVQYILDSGDDANPTHLQQLFGDLGDHKKNEV